MATIKAYETAAGRRYRVRYRKPDGKQTDQRGFSTKRDAELWAASNTVSKARGEYVDPTAARTTIDELATRWLAMKKSHLKESSYHSIDVAYRVHVKPRWGTTPIGKIKLSDVEDWVAAMSTGAAPSSRTRSTANARKRKALSPSVTLRALGVLAGILDSAVKGGKLLKNPARGIENLPKKQSKKVRRYLTDQEVIALASAAGDTVRQVLVLTLAYCGIRWGEAIGLRVEDIDFKRRRLRIARTATEVDGVIVEGEPKNWERRSVPFPAMLSKPLAALCDGKTPGDLVFCDEPGVYLRRPRTTHGAGSWFGIALRTAGLSHLTPHDLRHTAASLAISAGANVKLVQLMLGHKSAAVTLDTYADLFDDDLETVATRLNDRAVLAGVGKMWANDGQREPDRAA